MMFSRKWAMPNPETFAVPPIREFVRKYLANAAVSVDPFARNSKLALLTNDLDPGTEAGSHADAEDWLKALAGEGAFLADVALFDPPYSPDQMARAYQKVRLKKDRGGSRNSETYRRVRDALLPVLAPAAVVLSFGWNTAGMGKGRGFEIVEIMAVCHGGAHNDTLCVAEVRK